MARVVDLQHQPHCILMPRRAIQQSHRRLRLDIELLQVVDLPTVFLGRNIPNGAEECDFCVQYFGVGIRNVGFLNGKTAEELKPCMVLTFSCLLLFLCVCFFVLSSATQVTFGP